MVSNITGIIYASIYASHLLQSSQLPSHADPGVARLNRRGIVCRTIEVVYASIKAKLTAPPCPWMGIKARGRPLWTQVQKAFSFFSPEETPLIVFYAIIHFNYLQETLFKSWPLGSEDLDRRTAICNGAHTAMKPSSHSTKEVKFPYTDRMSQLADSMCAQVLVFSLFPSFRIRCWPCRSVFLASFFEKQAAQVVVSILRKPNSTSFP